MKKHVSRHYSPAMSNSAAFFKKNSGQRSVLKKESRPYCSEELLKQLNLLGRTPPFGCWYRQRTNDPL
jgi:hypothetical protein